MRVVVFMRFRSAVRRAFGLCFSRKDALLAIDAEIRENLRAYNLLHSRQRDLLRGTGHAPIRFNRHLRCKVPCPSEHRMYRNSYVSAGVLIGMANSAIATLFPLRTFRLFFVVGAFNTVFSIAAFPLIYISLHPVVPLPVILVISHSICTATSYVTHRVVTFQSAGGCSREWPTFFAVSLMVYFVNLLLLKITLRFFGNHPMIYQTIITMFYSAVLSVPNFLAMRELVFQKESSMQQQINEKPR